MKRRGGVASPAILAPLTLGLLVACATGPRTSVAGNDIKTPPPPVVGSVDRGFLYRIAAPVSAGVTGGCRTQAALGDVAIAASVSLIQPASGSTPATTVATALTDSSGNFQINLNNWSPASGQVYFLEAFKGLNGNQAGYNAARVRTLISFVAGSWQSLTGSSINLNLATTAVSAAAQIDAAQGGTVTLSGLLPSLTGTVDASGSPETLTVTTAGVSRSDYDEAYQVVNSALGANEDPIAMIGKSGGNFYLIGNGAATALGISPGLGANVGDTVTLSGNASFSFDPTPAHNQVTFNGATASVTSVTNSNQTLTAVVPGGATRGPVYVVGVSGARNGIVDYPIYGTIALALAGIPGSTATASVTLTPPAGGGSPVTQSVASPAQTATFSFKTLIPGAGWTISGQAVNSSGTVWASSTQIAGATSSVTLVPAPVVGPYSVNSGLNGWQMALQVAPLSGSATGSF